MQGTIKKIITEKGFGFITIEGREKDLFFHLSACKGNFDNLREGDQVTIGDIVNSGKGDSAVDVELA